MTDAQTLPSSLRAPFIPHPSSSIIINSLALASLADRLQCQELNV